MFSIFKTAESGIRSQIAQTIVHLGVNLEGIITKATLIDAFLIALRRINNKKSSAMTKAKDQALTL